MPKRHKDIYVQREGTRLVASSEYDLESIMQYPEGQQLKINQITRPRSLRANGMYWSRLAEIVKSTCVGDIVPTAEDLHTVIKLRTGYTIKFKIPFTDEVVEVADSTSFDNMDQTQHNEYLKRADKFLIETFGVPLLPE